MKQSFTFIGCVKRAGTSKTSGKPYIIFSAHVIEPIIAERTIVECSGFSPRELNISPDAFVSLSFQKFPFTAECNLQIGFKNQLEIVSVITPPVKSAVA